MTPRQQIIQPVGRLFEEVVEAVSQYAPKSKSVFSGSRQIVQPKIDLDGLKADVRQKMDGLALLKKLPDNTIPLFFLTHNTEASLINSLTEMKENAKRSEQNFHRWIIRRYTSLLWRLNGYFYQADILCSGLINIFFVMASTI